MFVYVSVPIALMRRITRGLICSLLVSIIYQVFANGFLPHLLERLFSYGQCLQLHIWHCCFVFSSLLYVRIRGYICAHSDLGCKDTKNFWSVQIYWEKSAEYFSFVREMRDFGEVKSKKGVEIGPF